MSTARYLGILSIAALTATACTTQVQPAGVAPVAAQLSVERFLQAVNSHDYQGMGYLFGTSDGPLMETGSTFGCFFKKIGSWFGGQACTSRAEVELRMSLIADVLQHEDYRIAREEPVAGRTSPARRVFVDFTVQGEPVVAAPFVVVQTSERRWLVEQAPLEQVMAR